MDVYFEDSDGAPVTGKVYTDVAAYYHRPGASPVSITLATLAANTTAWASGGFRQLDATNMPMRPPKNDWRVG